MTPERSQALKKLLTEAGFAGARIEPLAADASFRSYDRVFAPDGRRAVLMNAPPDREDVRPFRHVAEVLAEWRLSPPQVLAADAAQGFLLLEDLGDDLFGRVIARDPAMEEALYAAAVDVLVSLAGRAAPPDLPRHDLTALLDEVALFLDWRLPEVRGRAASEAERRSFRDAWAEALICPSDSQNTLVLRDYHVDNLIWLPDRDGPRRVGLLDFQDAVGGHPAYDLASLLADVRRDVPAVLEDGMIRRYLSVTGAAEAPFRAAYATLGAQRNTRILGVFTRLWRRDGKARYLDWLPRAWRLLRRDLGHPALQPVAAWFERHMPDDPAARGETPE
ncbi:MAG: hypothetical protein TEF_00800 [Rhizobiales bacterium NRL2]|jgi:hypothetical protein|nr:MAG: hypothetical protein TEF_00800 [Rhizobiales bacterium NRL2]